jgi:hypothetical protein
LPVLRRRRRPARLILTVPHGERENVHVCAKRGCLSRIAIVSRSTCLTLAARPDAAALRRQRASNGSPSIAPRIFASPRTEQFLRAVHHDARVRASGFVTLLDLGVEPST